MGSGLVPAHGRLRLRHGRRARRRRALRRPALPHRHVQQRRQLVPHPRMEVHEHGPVLHVRLRRGHDPHRGSGRHELPQGLEGKTGVIKAFEPS